MTDADIDRAITQRANYLSRATDLRKKEAKAIAWTGRGYSWRSVARRLDTGKSTAKGWIERAMAQYGLSIAETLTDGQLEPPLSEPSYEAVGPDYLDTLEREDQRRWVECVDRHHDSLPQEWVAPIMDEIRSRGLVSIDG